MLLATGSRFGVFTSNNVRRHTVLALAVAAAYYFGSLLGFALRLPPTGISFLWPPTAILTAILLSISPRSWVVACAGAFAAHAVAHSIDGLPATTWLIQFAANCFQALLGAGLARSIYSGTEPFSSRRSVLAFVVGVVLVAPAVASLLAAQAYVSMGWSATFWSAWRSRELSNVLAALTFTPPLVVAIARLRPDRDRRFAPATFGWRVPALSCALFVIAIAGGKFIVSENASVGGLSAADRLTIVQLIVAAASVPLMLLAAVMEEGEAERRQVRESQRRYALATAAGGVGVWEWSAAGHAFVDPRLSQRLGYHPHTDLDFHKWSNRCHPDDRDRVTQHIATFVATTEPFFEFECRVLDHKGDVRLLFVRGAATRDKNEVPIHVIGTYIDTTEQRMATQALADSESRLRDLAGRLISVEADERARIARNLHDSASQDIAALAIRLGVMQRDSAPENPELKTELTHLRDMAIDIGDQIRHFSHELHPAILNRAGLPVALAAYCDRFAADHKLRVDADCSVDHTAIPPSMAVCLYRVCQEALHNVAKHANASQVSVTLTSTADTLRLVVRDDGRGMARTYDPTGGGIGLSSLDERLRLLNGTLSVDSRPGEGTTIVATIPIGRAA